ncbi:MAG: DUF721 domain-containing protein [Candidatus Margulisiibacteriota bacterium]
MEKAGQILKNILDNLPSLKNRVEGYSLLERWNELADKKNISWPVKFTAGTLFVGSQDPSFAQEIKMKRTAIIEKMNKEAGAEILKDIRINICAKKK